MNQVRLTEKKAESESQEERKFKSVRIPVKKVFHKTSAHLKEKGLLCGLSLESFDSLQHRQLLNAKHYIKRKFSDARRILKERGAYILSQAWKILFREWTFQVSIPKPMTMWIHWLGHVFRGENERPSRSIIDRWNAPSCFDSASKTGVQAFLVLTFLASCSHVVVVKSEPPGARVRLVNANGKLGPSLGVTPLDLTSLPSADAVLIEIDKEAHLPKQVVVPKVTGSRLTINTKLQPLSKEYLAERSRLDFASSLNANLFEIFKLQSLILDKNTEEVLKMEKSMRDQWEGISLYQSLLGNFYYLTGDYKAAKTRYEKALSLDPRNDEARNMLSNLR